MKSMNNIIYGCGAVILSCLFASQNAQALSAGCAELNGQIHTQASLTGAAVLNSIFTSTNIIEKGEYIGFKVEGTIPANAYNRFGIMLDNTSTGGNYLVIDHTVDHPADASVKSLMVTAGIVMSDAGLVDIKLDESGNSLLGRTTVENVKITFVCQNVGEVSDARTEIHRDSLSDMAILGQNQITKMTSQRLQRRFRAFEGINSNRSGLAFQLNDQEGKSAGDLSVSSAVWGNVAVTHFADHYRPTNYTGLHGTLMVGADHFVTDSVMMGAALNVETSYLDLGRADGEVSSTAIGLTPYLAWRIDDIFSLSAQGNVSFMQSRMSDQLLQFGPITETDMDALRWSLAVTGDGFWQWGNWGLLSGLNLSYGQLLTRSTIDNQGNQVSGTTSQNGSVSLMIQPSYYWEYDRHLALEPYFLAEYQHDFTMQKVSTPTGAAPHPNDPDQIRLGLGLNIFGGAFYSGNVEATTVVGREDYSETSLGATLRVNF